MIGGCNPPRGERSGGGPATPLFPSGRPFSEVYSSVGGEFETIFYNLCSAPQNKPLQVEQCYNALVDTLYLHATEIATNERLQVALLSLLEDTFQESINLGCLAFDAIYDLTWKNPYEKRYQSLNILYNCALRTTCKKDFEKLAKPMLSMMDNYPVSTSDFVNDHMKDFLSSFQHEDLSRRAVCCQILSFIIGTQIIKHNPAFLDLLQPVCNPLELLQYALETHDEWYRSSILKLLTSMVEEYTYELSSQIACSIAIKVSEYLEPVVEPSKIPGLLSIISTLAISQVFSNAPWNFALICSFLTDRDWSQYSAEVFLSAGLTVVQAVYTLFSGNEELFLQGVTCMYGFLNTANAEPVTQVLKVLLKLITSKGQVRDPEGFVKALVSCLHRLPHIPDVFKLLELVRSMYGDAFMGPIYNLLDEYMTMDQKDVNFGKLNSLLKFMGPRVQLKSEYFSKLVVDLSEDAEVAVLVRSLPLLHTLERTEQLPEALDLLYHEEISVRETAVNVVASLCEILIQQQEQQRGGAGGCVLSTFGGAGSSRNGAASKFPAIPLLDKVREAVNCIVDVAEADREPSMRLAALKRLWRPLDPYLCEQHNLDALFVVMNDTYDSISDEALKILCRLLHSNTEVIHSPLLRLQEYLLSDLTSADVSLTFNLKKIHILTVCADQYCLLLKSESVENVVIHILSEQTFLSERFAIALLELVTSILEHAGPYHHCDPIQFYDPLMKIINRREAPPSLRRAALETLTPSLSTFTSIDNATFWEIYVSLMRIVRRRADEPRLVKIAAVKAISTIGAIHPVKVRKMLVALNTEEEGEVDEPVSTAVATSSSASSIASPAGGTSAAAGAGGAAVNPTPGMPSAANTTTPPRVHYRARIHNRMDERYPMIMVYYIAKALSMLSVDHRHQMEMITTLYNTIITIGSSQRAAILLQILPELLVWLLDPMKIQMSETILRLATEFVVLQRQFPEIIRVDALKDLLTAVHKFCAFPRASQSPTCLSVIQLLDELAMSVPEEEMRLHRWSLEFIHQRLSQNKSDSKLMKKVILALESFLVVIHQRDLKLILPHVLQCMEPTTTVTPQSTASSISLSGELSSSKIGISAGGGEIAEEPTNERVEITNACFHFVHCIMVRFPDTVQELFSQIALKVIAFVDESSDDMQLQMGLQTLAYLFHVCSGQSDRFSVAMRKLCASKKLPPKYFAQLMERSSKVRVETRDTTSLYWYKERPFKLTCNRVWGSAEDVCAEFSRCLRCPGMCIKVLKLANEGLRCFITFSFLLKGTSAAENYRTFCVKARDPRSSLMQVLKVTRIEQAMEPPSASNPEIITRIGNVPSVMNKEREQSWITWFHSTCVQLVKHSPYKLITKSTALTDRNMEYARSIFCFAATAYIQHLNDENREKLMRIFNRVLELSPHIVQQHFFTLAVFMDSERNKVGPLQRRNEPLVFTVARSSPNERFGINYDMDAKRRVVVTRVAPDGLGSRVGVPVGANLWTIDGTRIYQVSDIRNLIEGKTTIELAFARTVEYRQKTSENSLLDLNILAKMSFESQRHSKAIYFNEVFFEELFRSITNHGDLKADSPPAKEVLKVAERLFELYGHLNFNAMAQGLAKTIARRFSSNLLEPDQFRLNEVSILEQLHWLQQALRTYREHMVNGVTGEVNLPAFIAVLRCQESLGHFHLNVHLMEGSWDSFNDQEKKLVAPYRARAAFWLGQWEELDAVAEHPNLLESLGNVERCAYLFRHQKLNQLLEFTAEARAAQLDLFNQCLNESYGRVCDTLVALRHLRHFEELVSYTTSGPQRREMLRRFWGKRLLLLTHRPVDLCTVLAINSLVLEPHEDYHAYVVVSQALTKVHWYELASFLHTRLLGPSEDIRESLVKQKPDFIHAYLKNIYATASHEDAFELLNDVLSTVRVTPDFEDAELWGPCHLLLGEWMIGLHPERGEEAILKVQRATELSPNNYAAFHSLGILHYDLSREPDLPKEECARHHVASIHALFRSVDLCSHNINIALQDVLRILSIWFSNVDVEQVNEAVHMGIDQLQDHVWLSVIPQLIARISVNSKLARTILAHLLIRVGQKYPQALIYPLAVAENSPDIIRRAMAKRVLAGMRVSNETLVHQASLISSELIRIAILNAEKWHAAIQSAANTPEDRTALIAALGTTYSDTKDAVTPNEKEFQGNFSIILERIMYSLQKGDTSTAWSLLKQVYSQFQRLLEEKRLSMEDVSPILATIKETSVAVPGTFEHEKPLITIHKFHSEVEVMPSKQRPRRVGLDASNGRRYLFLLKGHEDMRQDERVMQFIGLLDAIFMMENSTSSLGLGIPMYAVVPLSENVGVVGWMENTTTIYKMLETSRAENGISIYEEVEMIMKKGKVRSVEEYHNLSKPSRVGLLRYTMENTPDDELRRIIWDRNASCEEWLSYRNNYGLTLAAMSMAGYVLGLGDRHLNNLMLGDTGMVVHIDFGDCFEVAMNRSRYAEAVPFRLTRLIVKALGVTGVDGVYRITSEIVMKNLRKHSENLLSILEAFIYDPLINWRLIASTAGEDGSPPPPEANSATNADARSVLLDGKERAAPLALSKSVLKAQQVAVGGYTYAMEINAEETRNEQGDRAWDRVRAKLTGQDFSEAPINSSFSAASRRSYEDDPKLCSSWGSICSDLAMEHSSKNPDQQGVPLPTTYLGGRGFVGRESLDVNKQVDRLIEEARSLDNLAEAFLTGWAPFW